MAPDLTPLHPILQQMSPSVEQIPAILARGRNVVVTAGAGSGKTRTLVARYLALLCEDAPLRSIVAITFTKKAAREMRNRVRDEMRKYLDRAGLSPHEEARWRGLYTELDGARIGTIHGLCTDILRAHAAEAGIDPRFGVLEEAAAAIVQSEAVEETLAWAAQEPVEAPLFGLLGERKFGSVLEWLLGHRLDAGPCLANLPEPVWPRWEELVLPPLRRFVDSHEVQSRFADLLALRSSGALARASAAGDRLAKPLAALLDLWDQVTAARALEDWAAVSVFLAPLRDNMKQTGAAKNWPGGSPKPVIAELQGQYDQELKDLIGKGSDLALDRRLAEAQPALRLLLAHALAVYTRKKNERQALDFDDLEQGALDLLRGDAGVRAHWQDEVGALLVDEFQDTNVRQRDLLALLAGDRPSLFVVGDAKQSIYRFRGADVTVFRGQRQAICAAGGQECLLEVSYRAHQGLVAALNALLRPVLGEQQDPARPWVEPFAALQHHRTAPALGFVTPYVELHLALGAKASGGLDRAADALAQRLAGLVRGGQCLVPAGDGVHRPFQYHDIAILCRASASFTAYEDALERAGVPFLTVAGKGFYDRPEVRDLLNALEALTDPGYDLALAGLLRSPAFAVTDAALYLLCQAEDQRAAPCRLWDVVQAPPADLPAGDLARLQRAAGAVTELNRQVGRTSVADLLAAFLAATGYRAALLAAGQTRAARNVSKLLSDAYASGMVSVGEFLAFVRSTRESGAREGEARATAEGAVQILSVHAAKGMEFPVVVLGDVTRDAPGGSPTLLQPGIGILPSVKNDADALPMAYRLFRQVEDDRESAESDRLLYVAATRAQEMLILSGCANPTAAGGLGKLGGWLGRLQEAGSLVIAAPNPPGQRTAGAPLRSELHAGGQPVGCAIYPEEYAPPPSCGDLETDQAAPAVLPPPLLGPIASAPELADEPTAAADRTPPQRVWQVVPRAARPTAPAWVVGSLVHRALAAWRFPDSRFEEWVTAQARSHGLTDARHLHDAYLRTRRMLSQFQEHPLCRQMADAPRRFHEVPYSIVQNPGGNEAMANAVENGIIDALFGDGQEWTLVEFKTDEVRDEAGLAGLYSRTDYLRQTSRYRAAAATLLGREPAVVLCFLDFAGGVRVERTPGEDR